MKDSANMGLEQKYLENHWCSRKKQNVD